MPRTGRPDAAAVGGASVSEAFDNEPPAVRRRLLELRSLILETAATTPGVGRIEETLKWGQPSYLTPEKRSGTTIRIGAVKDDPERVAVYVHCQTRLVDRFREAYGEELVFDGNRGILLDVDGSLPEGPLRHCIAMALTYHASKKSDGAGMATTPAARAPRA